MNRIVALYSAGAAFLLLAAGCVYWFYSVDGTIEQTFAVLSGLVSLVLSAILLASGFYLGGLRVRRTGPI